MHNVFRFHIFFIVKTYKNGFTVFKLNIAFNSLESINDANKCLELKITGDTATYRYRGFFKLS